MARLLGLHILLFIGFRDIYQVYYAVTMAKNVYVISIYIEAYIFIRVLPFN